MSREGSPGSPNLNSNAFGSIFDVTHEGGQLPTFIEQIHETGRGRATVNRNAYHCTSLQGHEAARRISVRAHCEKGCVDAILLHGTAAFLSEGLMYSGTRECSQSGLYPMAKPQAAQGHDQRLSLPSEPRP